jgi:hypothetical protein
MNWSGTENDFGTSYSVERDPATDKPMMRVGFFYVTNGYKVTHYAIPDKERGAVKRLEKIMAQHPKMTHYLQTDPRGASLYLVPKAKFAAYCKQNGKPENYATLDCCYTSVGICVY